MIERSADHDYCLKKTKLMIDDALKGIIEVDDIHFKTEIIELEPEKDEEGNLHSRYKPGRDLKITLDLKVPEDYYNEPMEK